MTQKEALKILKTGANVFLTGEPGSGKTHVINEYAAYLRSHGIEPAVTASTGIAATHIGGVTIHSWSGIGIKSRLDKYDLERIAGNERVAKRIKRAKVLIIDEISMLSPETLNLVDLVCRKIRDQQRPFGGLQIILVGDFFQLPPIRDINQSDPQMMFAAADAIFAYDSSAWQKAEPVVCYLDEQYRQDDHIYLSLLSAIRSNDFNEDNLQHLLTRKVSFADAPVHIPKLFSHNIDVDRVNNEMLVKLSGQAHIFEMISFGPKALVMTLKKGCLSPEKLQLKIGAIVMFTKNNIAGGFVNGTLGLVEKFDKDSGYPIIKIKNGRLIKAEPMDWTIEEDFKIRAKITQLPLRLAWAITVHKSQGMSLDEAVMDLSAVFEYGQGYVALSRLRRLTGLYILGWNERAFIVHPAIVDQDQNFRRFSNEALLSISKLSKEDLQKKWHDFIIACDGELEIIFLNTTDDLVFNKSKETNTYEQTLILWREGKNLGVIAKARGLKEKTILGHLEKLSQGGEISHKELGRLLTPTLEQNREKIIAVFQELGPERLSPVFEKLNGEVSYDDLRIARMLFITSFK